MALQSANRLSRPKILLVEDNLADAHMALEVFREGKTSVEITRVENGEEAIQYLEQAGSSEGKAMPDLILLDLNLPRKNGLEVLQEIKKNPRLDSIPVLVLTCSTADSDKRRAYETRANFYLVKPVDLHDFYDLAGYVEQFWLKGIPPPNPGL